MDSPNYSGANVPERTTYSLIHDGNLLKVTSWSSEASSKAPINYAMMKEQALLISHFIKVTDSQTFLRYINNFGFPSHNPDCIKHDVNLIELADSTCRLIILDPAYYIDLAAMIRWLVLIIQKTTEPDVDSLSKWITASKLMLAQPLISDHSCNRYVSLVFRLRKHDLHFNDWKAAERLLKPKFDHNLSLNDFQKEEIQETLLLDFANQYLAFHLNGLVCSVHPAVNSKREVTYHFKDHIEAMGMFLLLQFSGAGGIAVCRNPNCPTRFYIVTKNIRKRRCDRQYCGRPGCQKWCVENLGRVRNKYDNK